MPRPYLLLDDLPAPICSHYPLYFRHYVQHILFTNLHHSYNIMPKETSTARHNRQLDVQDRRSTRGKRSRSTRSRKPSSRATDQSSRMERSRLERSSTPEPLTSLRSTANDFGELTLGMQGSLEGLQVAGRDFEYDADHDDDNDDSDDNDNSVSPASAQGYGSLIEAEKEEELDSVQHRLKSLRCTNGGHDLGDVDYQTETYDHVVNLTGTLRPFCMELTCMDRWYYRGTGSGTETDRATET